MRDLSRREALVGGLVATAGAAAVTVTSGTIPATAAAPKVGAQVPGIYRRKLGDMEVTALLDGYLDVDNSFWHGIEQEDVTAAINDAFLPQNGKIRVGVTSYLINTGKQLVLVDSGSADLFGPTAGRFPETLAAAGVAPEDIDVILITHMHPDHIGSLLSSGKAVFPNAEMHICGVDFDYWTADANKAGAPDFAKPWFDAAIGVRDAYDGRINLFTGSPELVTGISAEPLVGHTPGHTGYRVSSGSEQLLIWGDACGVAAVQFSHPDAGLVFDVDSETGRRTRNRLLDMAANERVLVASAHLPFPTFGHVARRGNAYAWVPDEYQYEI
ncbi:MBL fold metallo-hydrolase [Roseibium sp. SCP14]|uniref:MBL fold metallo-hydrolase n=1 Tax=Roseibium sp. SCP14 TaxID=3141375 RepID=UPI0033363E07